MSLLDILCTCKGAEITIVIIQAEPGGRNDIQPLSFRQHIGQGIIAAFPAYGMPCQTHFARHSDRSILLRHIIRHCQLCLSSRIGKPFIFNISHNGIGGLHLAPALHLLQYFHSLSLFHFPQNGTLNPAQHTNLRVPGNFHGLSLPPLSIDLYMSVEQRPGIVAEQFYIICSHVNRLPFGITYHVLCGMTSVPVAVFPPVK